jgi:hypothetical protein
MIMDVDGGLPSDFLDDVDVSLILDNFDASDIQMNENVIKSLSFPRPSIEEVIW